MKQFPGLNDEQKDLTRKMGFVPRDIQGEVTLASESAIEELRAKIPQVIQESRFDETLDNHAAGPIIASVLADLLDRALSELEGGVDSTNWERQGIEELRRMIKDARENSEALLEKNLGLFPILQQPGPKGEKEQKVEEFLSQFDEIVSSERRDTVMTISEERRKRIFQIAMKALDGELASYELILSQKFLV
ncbi:MAG: hypothetical protein ACHQ03_12040 [Candidatus Bathyarchaeia archaeon]